MAPGSSGGSGLGGGTGLGGGLVPAAVPAVLVCSLAYPFSSARKRMRALTVPSDWGTTTGASIPIGLEAGDVHFGWFSGFVMNEGAVHTE